jgi:hypothetical protein
MVFEKAEYYFTHAYQQTGKHNDNQDLVFEKAKTVLAYY